MHEIIPALLSPKNSSQKEKEDLEEISSELELADEDEKVPYVGLKTTGNASDMNAAIKLARHSSLCP